MSRLQFDADIICVMYSGTWRVAAPCVHRRRAGIITTAAWMWIFQRTGDFCPWYYIFYEHCIFTLHIALPSSTLLVVSRGRAGPGPALTTYSITRITHPSTFTRWWNVSSFRLARSSRCFSIGWYKWRMVTEDLGLKLRWFPFVISWWIRGRVESADGLRWENIRMQIEVFAIKNLSSIRTLNKSKTFCDRVLINVIASLEENIFQ